MLRGWSHQVYDFREHGLGWNNIEDALQKDYRALRWANVRVVVMPCGRTAHLEAGWSIGHGKPTCFLFPTEGPAATPIPVDLMHDLGNIALSEAALNEWTEQFAFCPKCDLRLPSEEHVTAHITRDHLSELAVAR